MELVSSINLQTSARSLGWFHLVLQPGLLVNLVCSGAHQSCLHARLFFWGGGGGEEGGGANIGIDLEKNNDFFRVHETKITKLVT